MGLVSLVVGSTLTGSIVFVSVAGAMFAVVVLAGEAPHPAMLNIRNRVIKNEVNFSNVEPLFLKPYEK